MTPEREACYEAGHAAGLAGAPNTDCPYLPDTDEAGDWLHGHRYGAIARRNAQAQARVLDEIRSLSVGDPAFVWVSHAGGGNEYPVIVTHVDAQSVRVCCQPSTPQRTFRPFLARKGFRQLAGSGRGTQELSLRKISKAEALAMQLNAIRDS